MTPARPRLLAALAVALGLLLLGYGYALHRTVLVVRTDLGQTAAEPPDETVPDDVRLPDPDDWDDAEDSADDPLDELDKEPEAAGDDDWDSDGVLTKELEAEAGAAAEPQREEIVALTDGGLIRGAAQGTIVRLPDGRLALTWVGGGRAPTCFT